MIISPEVVTYKNVTNFFVENNENEWEVDSSSLFTFGWVSIGLYDFVTQE